MAAAFSIEDFALDFVKSKRGTGPTFRPNTLAEIDIREGILEDLALKTL